MSTVSASWAQAMDPHEIVDYTINLTNFIETNEEIFSYEVKAVREAVALGLIVSPAGYPPILSGKEIQVWFSVLQTQQDNVIFNTETVVPIEVTIWTSSNPRRKRQRTFGLKLVQQ